VLSRHQAHLEVTSEPGAGSSFAAVFPAGRAASRDAEPASDETAALGDGSAGGRWPGQPDFS
jgi:hypothetical protein